MLVDDALDEEDETFSMALQLAPGTLGVVGLRQHDGTACVPAGMCSTTATITDNDDPPTLSVAPSQAEEGEDMTFTVTLSAESGKTVTVDWEADYDDALGDTTADDGSDFTEANGTLTFEPGDPGETTKTFTVSTTEDETFEPERDLHGDAVEPVECGDRGREREGYDRERRPYHAGQQHRSINRYPRNLSNILAGDSPRVRTRAATPWRASTSFLAVPEVSGRKCARSDSSGYPTSTCTDLTAPDAFVAGTLSFTDPANTTLSTGTIYAVVASPTGSLMDIGRTSEDGEDMGSVGPVEYRERIRLPHYFCRRDMANGRLRWWADQCASPSMAPRSSPR